ncbi:MAG: glycoside hydrolase family 3 C-terminal domain-containing protein, partial [Lachnospiraceae bacterium]|nr:glycoside hydrolase family 3 C-terminal domain-containing protein [Lachnospiraceae bacterium]
MILDWQQYIEKAKQAVSEGVVLLKNEKKALPLEKKSRVAVFGRMQNNYYKSGTGSGGMVNVDKVWGIMDALALEDITLNEGLREKY